jgi:iron complex transport system ATP-binding protein
VLLSEGRIVADGPKQEMLTSKRLSGLFGADIQIARRDGYYSAF